MPCCVFRLYLSLSLSLFALPHVLGHAALSLMPVLTHVCYAILIDRHGGDGRLATLAPEAV